MTQPLCPIHFLFLHLSFSVLKDTYHITWYHIISQSTTSFNIKSHYTSCITSHHIIYHIISYHIISYHIISYHISYHIIYHIISYHIIYHIIYCIISYHTVQLHFTSNHIIYHAAHHITSYHILSISFIRSYRIIDNISYYTYCVVSWCVMSYHSIFAWSTFCL